MPYDFLLLDLVFALPALLILAVRRDLAPVMVTCVLASLPFALTEAWFCPTYWEPRFLFDLGARLGFGIEDFLFVSALAAFSSTAYAVCFRKDYLPQDDSPVPKAGQFRRAGAMVAVALAAAAGLAIAGVPMIYGSVGIMLLLASIVVMMRPDLRWPAIGGGAATLAVYLVLCQGFSCLLPGIFAQTWHAERFSGCLVLGVPLEELLYGFACGALATVFYPYVTRQRFAPRYRGAPER